MKKIIIGFVCLVFSLSATEVYSTCNVEAFKSANLAFNSSGTIKNVYVDVASAVKKGDKLVELINDEYKASLQIAKAELENAEVSLKYAKKDYERQVKIKHMIDEEKFDRYEREFERAKVAVSQAKANLTYKQALLDKTILYAPFDGVIFEKSVEVGDVVSGMMLRTIFKIQSQEKRKLLLSFDQKYHKQVEVGQLFKYSVDGDSKEYEGIISKIYPFANYQNRKIKAEVKANSFVVGLFCEGYIIVPNSK